MTALLAVDAAWETLRAGSDEWLWVGGLTLILIAWQAWLLVRRQPNAAAWFGVVGLLLYPLLGLWFSRVPDAGVVIFGLGTRELSIIAVMLGIAGGAVALATVPHLPVAARIVVGLLALYAIAALALGLQQQARLVELVSGGSLWGRLPVWLQGGFIGAAVLLPASLLVIIGRGVVALRQRQSQHWSLQAVAIILCLLMVAPAFGVFARQPDSSSPAVPIAQPTTAPPTALPLPQVPQNRAAPAITALPARELVPAGDPVQRLEAAKSRLTALRYDIIARAQALAPGHEAAFAFVRDHVGFDAYQGVLRGAHGTFTARRGNAWDRALLLAAFLAHHDVRHRFARATLDGATVDRLYGRLFSPPRPADGDRAGDVTGRPDNVALQRIRARAQRDYDVIMAAHGQTLSVIGARSSREQSMTELRDHVWVQAEVGGVWLDLDPTFTDARPGQRLAGAVSTFDDVPASTHQRVTVRVVAETLEGNRTQETEALSASFNTADILGRHVILGHVQGRGTGTGGGVFGAISGEVWTPLLWVDGTPHSGRPLRFGSGGETTQVFGGGNGPELRAEWLEVITERPDGNRDVSRRALVRRDDVTAALPRNERGSLAPQQVHALWLTAGPHQLLDYVEALQLLARATQNPNLAMTDEDALWALAIRSFPIVAWSEHVIIPAADADPGVRVYSDTPRAIVVSHGPSADPQRAVIEYDLLRDRVRTLPRDSGAEQAAVERRVWFGVLESALEHELAALAVAIADGRPADLVSTSGLLTEAGVTTQAAEGGITRVIPAGTNPPRGWWDITTDGTTRAVLVSGIGGASYSRGGGGAGGRILRPGGGALPSPGQGKTYDLSRPPRSASRPHAPRPAARGASEYPMLAQFVAAAAVIIWGIVALEILAAVAHGDLAIDSLPTESTP